MSVNKDITHDNDENDNNTNCSFTLREIQEILSCTVLTGEDKLDMPIEAACASDLMSDVLAFSKPNALLLTGLTNAQVLRTAEMVDIHAVIFVRGKHPGQDALRLSGELGIPLMSTSLLMYEASGRLYEAGLSGAQDDQQADS